MASDSPDTAAPKISPELLHILRCPVTHVALTQVISAAGQWWIASADGAVSYPIEEGLPMITADRLRRS